MLPCVPMFVRARGGRGRGSPDGAARSPLAFSLVQQPNARGEADPMTLATIAALAYAGLSTGTFALYGWDKLQARRGGRRVSEARLHGLALLGGFAGA